MNRCRILACFVVAGCGSAGADRSGPSQPIAFDHALHVGKRKIPCTDCHTGAKLQARAGLPSLQQCLLCHMRPQGERPTKREQVVRRLAAEGAKVRWNRVTHNPGHVYFSHRAHVGLAGMSCARCHGDVRKWRSPPEQPNGKLQSMDRCMDCHRRQGASNRCSACHH